MKNSLRFLIFNFVGLQATWAACAYGATHSFPALGLYVGLAYVIAHFYLSTQVVISVDSLWKIVIVNL